MTQDLLKKKKTRFILGSNVTAIVLTLKVILQLIGLLCDGKLCAFKSPKMAKTYQQLTQQQRVVSRGRRHRPQRA